MLALVDVAGAETEPGLAHRRYTRRTCDPRCSRGHTFAGGCVATAAVLTDVLGFNKVGQEEALIRFRASEQVIPDALQKAKEMGHLSRGRG
jgi:hypothetical protein